MVNGNPLERLHSLEERSSVFQGRNEHLVSRFEASHRGFASNQRCGVLTANPVLARTSAGFTSPKSHANQHPKKVTILTVVLLCHSWIIRFIHLERSFDALYHTKENCKEKYSHRHPKGVPLHMVSSIKPPL
jgi:hypothetical protein